eukprot:Nk52_evm4s307 gene=Nk52_evmTU4s307
MVRKSARTAAKSAAGADKKPASKANKFKEALEDAFPTAEVLINHGMDKPRRGAFECTFVRSKDKKSVEIWTGVKKGPPRKLKWPDHDEIIAKVKKEL